MRYDDNSQFGSKVTYRMAPAYLIESTGTKLRASVGTGFKAPTLEQLYQSFPPFFVANPNLKPETSVGYDVGIEQAFPGTSLRVGATYFRNDIRDLIAYTSDFSTQINVGRAKTSGVESFVAYKPAPSLTLRLDYTYTQATDEVSGQVLLRRPKQKAGFNAAWQPIRNWTIDATLQYVGPWKDISRDGFASVDAPGFTTVNIASNYELSGHWGIYGRINNALAKHYENPTGFLQPPTGVFAGIKATF